MDIPPTVDLPRLRRLLGTPELAWLLDRVRDRMATERPLDTRATLRAATQGQRLAVERLLGRRLRPGASLTVPLAEVDRVLRESMACPDGLAAATVVLTGPVTDRRAEEAAREAAWQRAHAELDHPAIAGRPELAAWVATVEATGLLKRLSGSDPRNAGRLAADAARVLSALPADGLTLPVLAARTLGDAHALDDGRPLAALTLSAVRALTLLAPEATATVDGRRAAWAAVGVALDELSSRVLVLGLPGGAGSTTGRMLAAARQGGEPCVLTLRQLLREPDCLAADSLHVRVCENPAVLAAAADALGSDCPPLVCVEGNPSAAARTLLARLSAQGSPLLYHGDFDWGGIRIATSVLRLPGACSWRYDTPAYLAAVERGLGTPLTGVTTAVVPTPWDPDLGPALAHHGIRVEEEHLIDRLLTDLGRDAV